MADETQRDARAASALVAIQTALSRLRGLDRLDHVLDRGPEELCRTLGFDRAILFRIHSSEVIAERVVDQRDPAWAKQILALSKSNPAPLGHQLLETEMIRRRAPILVADPRNDPSTFKPLIEVTQTTGYVAAPIMPQDRVIGFIHCDLHYSARNVDEFDRDLLWAFTEGFGFALERTSLIERLRDQRRQIRQLVATTDAVVGEIGDASLELGTRENGSDPMAQTAASIFVAPESRLNVLLTTRELEVLKLMASGATNGGIAQRLVISEATVKSHVKHILRKLRAANRAEAVFRYMSAAGEPSTAGSN
jgi:DNA-binding CsgD family transcriptional regulator